MRVIKIDQGLGSKNWAHRYATRNYKMKTIDEQRTKNKDWAHMNFPD